ncbi:hypothetical protein KY332_04835 [Candidatus Woesearchaeota archaeon]|nr:hypothetical protein [Candidatus Woesearchaeota archaeon]
MTEITLNKGKGIWVAKTAVKMLHDKLPPFHNPKAIPETILPIGVGHASLEQALFLFYAVSMDANRLARDLYAKVREMVADKGAKEILYMSHSELTEMIDQYMGLGESGTGGHDQPMDTFYENNQILLETYDGDPRNILNNTNSPDEVIKRLTEFRQIGKGKAALLLKNYIKVGFFTPENKYDVPVKIDRHIIKMSLGTGVVKLKGAGPGEQYRSEKIGNDLCRLYREICCEQKIDPSDFDDALWVIGSSICIKKDVARCQEACYLEPECKGIVKMEKQGSYIIVGSNTRKETIDSLFPKNDI